MSSVFFDDGFVLDHVDFDTTRKAGWVAESLLADPVPNTELCAPSPMYLRRALADVHTLAYMNAVVEGESIAGSNWFPPKAEVVYNWASSHVGGMMSAVAECLVDDGNHGTLSSGFHHAKPNSGNGYCTFNGLAVAAGRAVRVLREVDGVDPCVAILDVDAHMGGGTHACVGSYPNIVLADVSTNSFDLWHPSADRHRIWFADADTYLDQVETACRFVIAQDPSVVLYNAGMDPYDDGVPADVLRRREELVAGMMADAKIPVAWCLAGGYTDQLSRDELVGLHRHTIEAFSMEGI